MCPRDREVPAPQLPEDEFNTPQNGHVHSVRRAELARLRAMLADPQQASVLVIGERGAGKSRLLLALEAESEHPAYRVQINRTESDIPLSGLSAVVAAFQSPRAMQLSVDLLIASSHESHPAELASAFLSFFGEQPQSTALLLIDDIDLMDEASTAVLAMVASRLGGSHVRLVGSASRKPTGALASVPRIKLSPLSMTASLELLRENAPPRQNEAVRQIVAMQSQGNPGALVHNVRSLGTDQLEGSAPIILPLRVTSSSVRTHHTQDGVRTAVHDRTLAALSCAHLTSTSAVLAAAKVTRDSLYELISSGVVAREGRYARIEDALVRTHIYWDLGSVRRRDYHQALATAEAESDADLALWHQSWGNPNSVSPAKLLDAATRFMYQGSTTQAIELGERGLVLAEENESDVADSVFRLARSMFHGGELDHASRYARIGRKFTGEPSAPAGLILLRTRIEFMLSQQVPVAELWEWVTSHGARNRAYASNALATIAIFHAERWELDSAKEAITKAKSLSDNSKAGTSIILRAEALISSVEGDPAPAVAAQASIQRRRPDRDSTAELVCLGRSLTFVDRYGDARRLFHSILGMEPEPHQLWLGTTRFAMVENEILAGNQQEATALIEQLGTSGVAHQLHRTSHQLLTAWYWLAQKESDRADEAIADCHRSLASGDNPALAARLEGYQGRFALLGGRLEESIAFLRSATSFATRLRVPVLQRYTVDLIEAYQRSGNPQSAMSEYQHLRSHSLQFRTRSAILAAARARALVAPPDAAVAAFEQAVALSRAGDPQFELGRTLLCFSDCLAELGRSRDSREQRLAARIVFSQVGATSWAAATALPLSEPDGVEHPLFAQMSDEERDVVTLVLRGQHNREIADQLFISLRTVEARLTRTYKKLGARSRSHLVAMLSPGDRGLATTTSASHGNGVNGGRTEVPNNSGPSSSEERVTELEH